MFEITSNFGARVGLSRSEVSGFVSFDEQRRKTVEAGLIASRAAVTEVGRNLEAALADDIRKAGLKSRSADLGERLYSVKVFPKRGLAYNPASVVEPSSKGAQEILESWELGAKITAPAGSYMPVPLPATMDLLGNGRASRKELYQRAVRRFGDPRLIPTANGNLLALFPLTVTRGGRIGSGTRRAVGGGTRTVRDDAHWQPMFVLTRDVQQRARTRARQIIAKAEADYPEALAAALARAWGRS
jgi:hypothetical protein